MSKTSEEWFLSGEGDAWWNRNQNALAQSERLERDPVVRALELFGAKPRRVLEIGAANGYRLNALRILFGCEVAGIEPSERAVEAGRKEFDAVDLRRGLAHELPFENASFDLVIVNFVLHWVGRPHLLRVVAEMDRVTQNGGLLLIGDFAPAAPHLVAYHHLPGADVWTWKQDYASLFCASQLYELAGTLRFDHQTLEWSADAPSAERASITLLHKNCGGLHAETASP